jgi:hypothetical protein
MSDRTQFWLGTLMLALAMGLLAGGLIFPEATVGQEAAGQVGRYALLTGIRGSVASTQTLYLLDDQEDLLLAFEYNSRSREISFKQPVNLRRYASEMIEKRARDERRRRDR